MKKQPLILLVGIFLIFSSPASFARDITTLVKQHTQLDDNIVKECNVRCKGNRRKGSLNKVTIRPNNGYIHTVEMWASLKNHQVDNTIFGKVEPLNYTIGVYVVGELDQRNCKIKITNVTLQNDPFKLAQSAKNEIGRVYDAPNCQQFL